MFLRKSVKNNFQTRTKAIKFAIIMNRKQRLSQNSFEKKVSNNEQETKAQSKQLWKKKYQSVKQPKNTPKNLSTNPPKHSLKSPKKYPKTP